MAATKPRKGSKWTAPEGGPIPSDIVATVELVDHGRVYLSYTSPRKHGQALSVPSFLSVPEKDFKKWAKP